jgi:hypothetical protein
MTDDQLMEQFHRIELRLERLDTKVEQLDKRLTEGFATVHTRLEGLETRLNTKAGNWTVGLWGATLAFLISAAGIGLGVLIQRHP